MNAAFVPSSTVLLAGVMLCLSLWLSPGCDKADNGTKTITVLCSGDTSGWLTPCGCATNQSGGLLRRGTRVQLARKAGQTLYFDVGGAPAGASEYDKLKFQAIIRGEMAMGLSAHNLGIPEAQFSPETIREVAQGLKAPFISANLMDNSGKPVAPPMMLIDAGGTRLAVVGVISREFSDPRWTVRDPKTAALDALRSVQGQYTAAMLLAYAPEQELGELARALPEFDVIVGGPTGQSLTPRKIGTVLLSSATNKGKFLVQLSAEIDRKQAWSWSGTVVELNASVSDDPAQKENLSRYLSDLKKQNFLPGQTSFVPQLAAAWPANYRFADPATCATCHPADIAALKMTKHSFAYNDLASRGMEVDPYCVRCHTTGYGLPDGFTTAPRTPAMVCVTCQTCHGPSQQHVDQPKIKTPYLAREQCHTCHDHENSPTFAYDAFWKDITHGKVKAVMPAASTQEIRP
jgi:hypothetical protein